MGACMSKHNQREKERSDQIDRELEEASKRFKIERKIILLGSRGSGKSTIVNQMKIMYHAGFEPEQLDEYRPVIYKNILDSAQQIIIYMKKNGLEYVEYSNRALAEKILNYQLDSPSSSGSQAYFSLEIAEAIHHLWKDPIIPKIMDEYSSDLYLMDSAAYFFSEVLRIGSPGYKPNEADVLCVRKMRMSVGIEEMRFAMGQLSIHMFDVNGQWSERNRWIHCFESVTSVIFCTALSEYDEVSEEEKTQNKMLESIALFESVINSQWFLQTSITLFLNKVDVFKDKLAKVPLERYFPEYAGGPDINKAAKYILWKFMQVNRARLSVYSHLTQAMDMTNIRLVFAAVKETILQNTLKDSGIL